MLLPQLRVSTTFHILFVSMRFCPIERVENIRSDFNYIKDKLGIEAHLPHKNESNHPPYRELYNEKTKNIVGKLYKKDIEILDYNFKE